MTASGAEAPADRVAAADRRRFGRAFILLVVGAVVAAGSALWVGPVALGPGEIAGALGLGPASDLAIVLRELRLPRVVLALLAGSALALAGAALQGYLRNPLADPGVLGVSGGAACGAVVAFHAGWGSAFAFALPLAGLAGAGIAVLLLAVLAGRAPTPATLLLAGVALGSLFGALTSLALNLAPSPFAAMEISFWLLGSLQDRGWDHVVLVLPFILVGTVLVASTGRALRALSLGEDAAASLGFDLAAVRLRLVLGAALLVGSVTAVAGAIGFVGLIVPHLLRPVVRGDPARLLALAAPGGAVLLVLADVAVRLIPTSGAGLQLGVVTALLGVPVFLALLWRARSQVA